MDATGNGHENSSKATSNSDLYAVIVPTYNERENLPIVIWLIVEAFKRMPDVRYEIIVVDDASPDGTANVCKQLGKCFQGKATIRLIERPGKLGLGSAYLTGLSGTAANFIILMDADLSHHPQHIPDFIVKQKTQNYDIVSGSRYISGGGVCGWNTKRVIMSRGANILGKHLTIKINRKERTIAAKVALAPEASDLTGSFRLYKRSVLEQVMREMTPKGYVFQMEIITRAQAMGYSVGEVPIVFVDRLFGESKLGAMEVFGYLGGLLKLLFT